MRHGVDLIPASLSGPIFVGSLISGTIGEYEDEDSMSSSISPCSIQHVAVGECLVARPLLLATDPGPGENVPICKVIRAGPLSLVILKMPDVLVTSV